MKTTSPREALAKKAFLVLFVTVGTGALAESEQILIQQMAYRAGMYEQAGFRQGVWQVNLAEFEGPVANQGRTEECTAYAVARAMGIRHSFDYLSFDFVDPKDLWSKYQVGSLREAVRAAESNWIRSANGRRPLAAQFSTEFSNTDTIRIIAALFNNHPVVIGTHTSYSWRHPVNGFVDLRYPVMTGSKHAVAIVGVYYAPYNRALYSWGGGFYVIDNSWGDYPGSIVGNIAVPISYFDQAGAQGPAFEVYRTVEQ